jgi:hypothetical protein
MHPPEDPRPSSLPGGELVERVVGGDCKGKPKYEQAEDTRFRFSSSIDGSKFKCRLDKSKYKGCTSPKNYKNLKPGKHTFHVYAISPEGVADESPSKLKFKVKETGD